MHLSWMFSYTEIASLSFCQGLLSNIPDTASHCIQMHFQSPGANFEQSSAWMKEEVILLPKGLKRNKKSL